MEVIDLSSSPEPAAARNTTRRARPSKKRPKNTDVGDVEVIEITDSDPSEGTSGPGGRAAGKRTSITGKKNDVTSGESATPGPSTAKQRRDEPTFGPPLQGLLDDARSVRTPEGLLQEQDERPPQLFYPGNDEDGKNKVERPRPAPPITQPPIHTVDPQDSMAPVDPPATADDPIGAYVARIFEIVPDVHPAHVLALIEHTIHSNPDRVVELAVHSLLENPSYPKVDRKGKRKREEGEEEVTTPAHGPLKPKIDYLSGDREYNGGPHYFDLSLEQLMIDFPRIPKPHIRKRLLELRSYARTFFTLSDELKQSAPPFKLKSTDSVVSRKGKAKQAPVFENEREWVRRRVTKLAEALADNNDEEDETGDGIECGCCFSSYAFEKMIQCPEAHLFCVSCMTSYSSTLLGEHNPNIVCMDQSGCKLPFPESELRRFLSPKLLELYERVKQRKEIEAAGLDNLEECPFCEYNTEAQEEKHLDAQHVVEEAMTRALMRNCPKCQKAFIKELGCNKMTCPNCRTHSCYVCRKVINGYDHFDRVSDRLAPPKYSFDLLPMTFFNRTPTEPLTSRANVSAAAKRALEELKEKQPEVDTNAIKVDLPVAGPSTQNSGLDALHAMPFLPRYPPAPVLAFPFDGPIPPPPPVPEQAPPPRVNIPHIRMDERLVALQAVMQPPPLQGYIGNGIPMNHLMEAAHPMRLERPWDVRFANAYQPLPLPPGPPRNARGPVGLRMPQR
ncbi:hypothetical protein ID866_8063 [Astraeus odoratus]|nr:hypothetical protein ID866_8063 [Astraeus odoratus]